MKKHTTLSSELVLTSHFYKVEREQVQLYTGEIVSRERVVHPGAVIMIPQEADGTILMIRQYRHAIRQEILELPAGTIDNLESPAVCAERELAEEVGMKADKWTELGTLFPAPGFCSEVQHLFLAREMTPFSKAQDLEELIEVVPMKPNQIEEAIKSGEISDGKTIASFFRAQLLGLIVK